MNIGTTKNIFFGKVVCPARLGQNLSKELQLMENLQRKFFPSGTRREIYVSWDLTRRGYQFMNEAPGEEVRIAEKLREAGFRPEINPTSFYEHFPKWIRLSCKALFELIEKMTEKL